MSAMQDTAARRIASLASHISAPGSKITAVREPLPAEQAPEWLDHMRTDGWGYADTEFQVNGDGKIALAGSRYPFSGFVFPNFRPWVEKVVGINVEDEVSRSPQRRPAPPVENAAFLAKIEGCCKRMSSSDKDRIFHGHGHTCQEVYAVRFGELERVPDLVVWPGSHDHVEAVVKLASENNVVIIPFGGGTSVSGALSCPTNEKRMIVSLDMHEMNAIKWIDAENMLVCMEAGIVGQDLKRRLEASGYTIGHEPDSLEFSSLGGWIATRASGMKKNTYGNIEDMLVRVKMVTAVGTIDRGVEAPRVAMGPDVQQMVLGSEGTLGVITEAVLRMRKMPVLQKYGSLIFPNLEAGINFMREIANQRAAPSSIRLVDNEQFQFGLALKPEQKNAFKPIIDGFKKMYVTKWHGFEPLEMCVATVMIEGTAAQVTQQKTKIYGIASQFRGLDAGEENGHRGYFLTFMIAYLRDFGMNYHFIAESFETSVPWSNVLMLCEKVKLKVLTSCKDNGVSTTPFVSCRVTQTYDTGACVYFYFGFSWKGLKDPVGVFSIVENDAREEILALGGSLSHHHGVGKHRQKWLPSQISDTGVTLLSGVKKSLDPHNIFGNGNLVGDGQSGSVPVHH
mmetsp:Transcript_81581/g.119503  ORF Transcript_81581/g.119503 Transcript_81581/m.119503 type:complete len:622 (+) Transcript_81581:118-1983(+)